MREGVLVNRVKSTGKLRVREGVFVDPFVPVDPFKPPGMLRVREEVLVDPLEPPHMLRVREVVSANPLDSAGLHLRFCPRGAKQPFQIP